MGLRGFHIRVHEMCEACVWIQNLGFLEGGRAEKVQVLGRDKYSDIPLVVSMVTLYFSIIF